MKLEKASKSLKGRRLRVLTAFQRTDGAASFVVGDIVICNGTWRDRVHVSHETDGGETRVAGRIPVGYFELADEPIDAPAEKRATGATNNPVHPWRFRKYGSRIFDKKGPVS